MGYGDRVDLDDWVSKWSKGFIDRIVKAEVQDKDIPSDLKTGGKNGYWYAGDEVDRKQMYGSNYEKLRVLKKKYDPDMMSHKSHPIPPAN
jgi:Berberine and berberine like